jgi:hypothetical protein
MMVVVSENGKLFHRAGCEFIHEKNKLRTLTAAEASRESYSPCVRCLKKYLATTASSRPADAGMEEISRSRPLAGFPAESKPSGQFPPLRIRAGMLYRSTFP